MRDLEGRLAVVTGASSGIGTAIARELAGRGARLFVTARRLDRLEALASELARAHGREVQVAAVDLLDDQAFAGLLERLLALRPDVLVNNAGFGMNRRFLDSDLARMEDLVRLDFNRPAALCRRLGRVMAERGSGAILNVASTAAFVPTPFHAVYSATKAAFLVFSEGLAMELREKGVTVTALCPGVTDTEFFTAGDYCLQSPIYRLGKADAAAVARAGIEGLLARRVVVVPGLGNRVLLALARILPRRLVVAGAGRAMSTD